MEEEDTGGQGIEKELREKVSLAARVAKEAPGLETTAFERVLDHLLRSVETINEPSPTKEGRGRIASTRRPVRTKLEELGRVQPILEAPSELVSVNSVWLMGIGQKEKVYGLLRLARDKFGLTSLTLPELRAVANSKFRLGIPDGSLGRVLSTAPPSEVGRESGPNGQTAYSLMQPGDAVLDAAIEKSKNSKEKPN